MLLYFHVCFSRFLKQIHVLQVRTFQRGCMGCDSFGGGVGDVADGETADVGYSNQRWIFQSTTLVMQTCDFT